MKNINLYKQTSITGLQFGTSQKVNLGGDLVLLKDSPNYNEDGTHFFSYIVLNTKTDEWVVAGSVNTLKELKDVAKSFKL